MDDNTIVENLSLAKEQEEPGTAEMQPQPAAIMEAAEQQSRMSPEYEAFFAQGVEKLSEILDDLNRRETLNVEIKNLTGDTRRLEKEIADEKKTMENELKNNVSMEREAYVAEETKKIAENNSTLRKIKNDRGKAKELGIKNRIENETADMVKENKETHRYVRRTLKENGLPGFCDTGWFYALYCPEGAVEWLIRILVFLTGVVLIPWLVVMLVDPWIFFKFLLWIGVMAVFIAVYITIFLVTKDKDTGTLEEIRTYRDKIAANKKKIKSVKKGIRSDIDESQYNLGEYDIKIDELEKQLTEITREKERKYREFDQDVKPKLLEEIRNRHEPVIDDKQYILGEKTKQYNENTGELNALNQRISQEYEKYLSKTFMTPSAIQNMLELLRENRAQNIGQAMEMLKR